MTELSIRQGSAWPHETIEQFLSETVIPIRLAAADASGSPPGTTANACGTPLPPIKDRQHLLQGAASFSCLFCGPKPAGVLFPCGSML